MIPKRYSLCRPFGEVCDIRLPKKRSGPESHRGFAFVDFANAPDAKVNNIAHAPDAKVKNIAHALLIHINFDIEIYDGFLTQSLSFLL